MKWRGLEEVAPATDKKTLAEQLRDRRELAERYTPPDIVNLYQRAIDGIQGSGLAERALKPGDHAPAFSLPDQDEKMISSASLLTTGALVICFFRGRWCPYDVTQLEAMNQVLPLLSRTGASLIAVSPQKPQQAFFMRDQHKLSFPLLCDLGNAVARQFGLLYRVPEYQQQVYQRSFVNLPFTNGDNSWELPAPATYIIGPDGVIRFARVDIDYRQRPEPIDILRVVSR